MSLAATKTVYGNFSNAAEWNQVIYDFSVDGGATGDYDVFTAGEDLVITEFYADFQTAVTSAGTCAMDLGIGDAGTDLWSAKALVNGGVAQITAGAIAGKDTANSPAPIRLASAEKIVMSIDTAVATAGKIAFNFLVKKQ